MWTGVHVSVCECDKATERDKMHLIFHFKNFLLLQTLATYKMYF